MSASQYHQECSFFNRKLPKGQFSIEMKIREAGISVLGLNGITPKNAPPTPIARNQNEICWHNISNSKFESGLRRSLVNFQAILHE